MDDILDVVKCKTPIGQVEKPGSYLLLLIYELLGGQMLKTFHTRIRNYSPFMPPDCAYWLVQQIEAACREAGRVKKNIPREWNYETIPPKCKRGLVRFTYG